MPNGRGLDEAAERDAAARCDRIAEDRHEQRAAAQRPLAAKACDERVGAAGEGVCDTPINMTQKQLPCMAMCHVRSAIVVGAEDVHARS